MKEENKILCTVNNVTQVKLLHLSYILIDWNFYFLSINWD